MKRAITTALCLFALVACDKKDEPKPDDPSAKNGTTTTNATATATSTAAPVTISDGDLSTPADFEDVAEKSITAKNYKQELSTIEGDIAKE